MVNSYIMGSQISVLGNSISFISHLFLLKYKIKKKLVMMGFLYQKTQ